MVEREILKIGQKMPALNGRFGASGAVARLKNCANLEVFAPVQAFVIPPPAPSRWDVRGNAGDSAADNETEK